MIKKILLTALLGLFALSGCYKIQEVLIQSDLMPIDGFSQIDMNAIAVLNFDASAIRKKNVDNIALRDAVAYDITKALYQLNKIRVIQGEAVQTVQEKEMVQNTKGDFDAASSTIERLVTYKYNPYQKVDAVLSGRILSYSYYERSPAYSYIEIQIKLVDNIDGTIYWVTKLKGNYKDVIATIANTLSNKTYSEPTAPSVTDPSLSGPK